MARRALAVTGYIIRNDKRVKRESLSVKEQKRLANAWNTTAMREAGYAPKPRRTDHTKEVGHEQG